MWTDTGQFGTTGYYAEAEVLFRVANVVGDVTGFSVATSAQDAGAITTALGQATEATAACVHWLSGQLQVRDTPACRCSRLPGCRWPCRACGAARKGNER